ncbi:MAG: cytochrome c3 family protein [Nitrospinota bacterium]
MKTILLLILSLSIVVSLPQVINAKVKRDLGRICLECHLKLKKGITAGKGTHSPVKKGRCTGCHNPHTSNHDALLRISDADLCYTCHKKEDGGRFDKQYIHKPITDTGCTQCHDPHYSKNKSLLIEKKGEGCFVCHKKEDIFIGKIVHAPVQNGNCMICHDPHTSNDEALLVKKRGAICAQCHTMKGKKFIDAHNGYPVIGTDCLSCHNPHSSDNRNLLRSSLHTPFADGKCTVCHNSPTSRDPVRLSKGGEDTCLACHNGIAEKFDKLYSHLYGEKENVCLNCHNPHASDAGHLLGGREERVCLKCHEDTMRRMTTPEYRGNNHPDIERCSNCHEPHGSNHRLFLINGEELCANAKCHATAGSFAHPMGKDVIDPRLKSGMSCMTCHNPMGTPYKYNLRFDGKADLCNQCHKF